MTNKEMKMRMVKHLTKLLVEENITDTNNRDAIEYSIESYRALGVYFKPFKYCDSGWIDLDEINVNTNEVINTYPIEPTRRDLIEIVLRHDVTRKQLESLKRDWKAFYNDPLGYRNLAEIIITYMSNDYHDYIVFSPSNQFDK